MTETGNASAEVMYHYAIHDEAHGYTQGPGREGTGTEDLDYKGITITFPGGDGDCSDGNIRAWKAVGRVVGYNLTGYATFTGNIKPGLLSTGLWEVWPLSRRGDICPGDLYLKPGSHVAMAINKTHLAEFWINEHGTITGGKPGDQTGKECWYRPYYNYPWECIMHYIGPDYLGELLAPPPEPPKIYPEMEPDMAVYSDKMTRLLNPYNGQHHFTTNPSEISELVKAGWVDEGVKWTMPMIVPVYRLSNPYTGDHLLTASLKECNQCIDSGWNYEGVGAYGSETGKPVHRLYNKYNQQHIFTMDINELSALKSSGWADEGVAFNAI